MLMSGTGGVMYVYLKAIYYILKINLESIRDIVKVLEVHTTSFYCYLIVPVCKNGTSP